MKQKLLFLVLMLSFAFASAQVPPNDTVATAIDITTTFTDVAVNTQNATAASSGDWVNCAINTAFTRVYYKHTPAVDGSFQAEILSTSPTMNTSFVIMLTAANPNATTDPELTLSTQNGCIFGDDTTINTVAGQTYYVAIHNLDNATDITFTVGASIPIPSNNELANVIDVTGSATYTDSNVSFAGATGASGGDQGGCTTGALGKVYYKFTAGGNGNITGAIATPVGTSLILFYESSSANPTTDAELDTFVPGTAGCAVTASDGIAVTASTTYYILAGNGDISDFNFTADTGALSVDEFENPNIIKVFPTIVSDIINVQGVALDHIKVYNVAGKQVLRRDNFGDITTNAIDVSRLNSGLYFIDINATSGKHEVIKFFKK